MEEQYIQKKLLEDVFGSSSDTDSEQNGDYICASSSTNPNPIWASIHSINGLWFSNDFLSSQHQFSLLSSIHNEGWFSDASHNQAMRFGDLPSWALELSDKIHEFVCFGDKETKPGTLNLDNENCVLPPQLLWREPFFDQLILNVYQPGHMCTCRSDAF